MRRFWLGAVCGIAFGTLLFTADEALKSRGGRGKVWVETLPAEPAPRFICANVAGGVLCMHGDITEAVFTLEPHSVVFYGGSGSVGGRGCPCEPKRPRRRS